MASEYEIAIKIAGTLDKSLQSAISGAQKELQGLGKTQSVSQNLNAIGNTMTKLGTGLTAGVTAPIVGLTATSVKEFGDVDKTLRLVHETMGSTQDEADQLAAAIKTAAANSVFGMHDAADATLNFARQGFTAAQAADMITPALNLAAGTETDLSEVTGGLGNALKMFGKDSSYASTAADILAKAQAQANTTTSDLFEAMAVAGPVANSIGWNMQDLATVVDIFGDAGISGSEGATALKTGLAKLASPAKDGAAWMKRLNLNIFNADGTMKSMADVQGQLHTAFAGLTQEEQLQAVAALFGKNQMAKWMTLINAAPDQVQKYSSALNECAGTSQNMADALMAGTGGSLEKLSSSFDVMKYNIGEIAGQVVKPFIDKLTSLIDAFNNLDPSMQKNIVKWVGIAAAAGPVLLIGGRLFNVVGKLVGVFGSAGGAIQKLAKHTKGIKGPTQQANTAMSEAAKNALGFGGGFAMAAAGVYILVKAAKELASAGPGTVVALIGLGAGLAALMAIVAKLAPSVQGSATGLIALGGAILMAAGGMSLMAVAATKMAQAGPLALAGLSVMTGGIIALMAVAGAMGPQLTAGTTGLLAFGGAVLMASAGMSMMALAATQIANAGPLALVGLSVMEGGMIALLAVAGAMGPALTAGASGMVAFGVAVLAASAGFSMLANAAVQLSQAGTGAQVAMALMAAGIAGLAVVFAALGPALLVASPAMLAFGAAVTLVGAGVTIASAGITLLASALPTIASAGPASSAALLSLGASITAFGAMATAGAAGAAIAAAGFAALGVAALTATVGILGATAGASALAVSMALIGASAGVGAVALTALGAATRILSAAMLTAVVPVTAITVAMVPFAAAALAASVPTAALGASMLVLAAGALAASACMIPLAAAMTLVSGSVVIIEASATAAGKALGSISKNAVGTAAKMGVIAAGAIPLSAALVPLAAAATAAAAAFLALTAGAAGSAAAITLLSGGVVLLSGALALTATSITLFTAAAAQIPGVATPAASAFTLLTASIIPFSAAVNSAQGPLVVAAAAMVTFSTGVNTAAGGMASLQGSLAGTIASLSALGAIAASAMAGVTNAITASMMASNAAVVTGMAQMRSSATTGMAAIQTQAQTNANAIQVIITAAVASYLAVISSGGSQVAAQCASIAVAMTAAFFGLQGQMFSAGQYAMSGLRNGIASAGVSAIAEARSIANQVASTVNSALKIHSPSRVLEQSGIYAGEGLAEGMKDSSKVVATSAAQNLAAPIAKMGIAHPSVSSQSSVLSDPFGQMKNTASAAIPAAVDTLTGNFTGANTSAPVQSAPQFIYSPTYRIEGSGVTRDDVIQADRMSQDDFEKMMNRWMRSQGRKSFAQ